MLVLRRYYQNLLGESIQLDIHQFTNCCHIIITRNNRSSRWYCLWCLGTIAFFILIISFIISFNIKKIFDRIAVLFAALVLIIVLFYWRSPINQESLILLDNVSGIETTNRNIFGEKAFFFYNYKSHYNKWSDFYASRDLLFGSYPSVFKFNIIKWFKW